MQRKIVYAGILAMLIVPQVWGDQCPDGGTYAAYLAPGFSCTIGDKIFSGFTYTSAAQGGAVAIQPAGITVDTLGPAGSMATFLSGDIGLQFNAAWSANANQTTDSTIGFTVTVAGTPTPMIIEDVGLAQLSAVTPNGSASVAENGCGPAPCTPGTISVLTFDTGTTFQRTANTIFTPIGSITVAKDIAVTGGTTGFAALSQVQDTFSQVGQVPEPASILLLGSVLVCLGSVVRRRVNQKA